MPTPTRVPLANSRGVLIQKRWGLVSQEGRSSTKKKPLVKEEEKDQNRQKKKKEEGEGKIHWMSQNL